MRYQVDGRGNIIMCIFLCDLMGRGMVSSRSVPSACLEEYGCAPESGVPGFVEASRKYDRPGIGEDSDPASSKSCVKR